MFLSPKKPKFTKSFSGRKIISKTSTKDSTLRFSNICLVASESGIITNFQMESIRRFLRKFLKKKAQLFFRLFPNIPITKKPNEIRLGRGKGKLKYWAFYVKKNDIIIEVCGAHEKSILFFLNEVKIKMSTKTYIHNRKNRWIL